MVLENKDDKIYRATDNVPKRLPPLTPPRASVPSTSNNLEYEEKSCREKFCLFLYDKDKGEYFYRTCSSWFLIIVYFIMYLLFLSTFTLLMLYTSLTIVKQMVDYNNADYMKLQLLTYPEHGIGLTATPVSETSVPLIWYKYGEKEEYEKYIHAIDKFLSSSRRKREVNSLGPCGQTPFGYGKNPCIIIRINKQLNWAGKPLLLNSTVAKLAPAEVQAWIKADTTKLWLQCTGYHSYDKEHIGRIKYYPDPPGFDASMFPLNISKSSPLVAIQISEFTIGISLAIECKLWYDTGPSTIDFMLYIAPQDKIVV